jgi:hypothetical protein
VITVFLSILLFCSAAQSQEPANPPAKDEPAPAELRKKAVDLVQSVSTQIGGLRSRENRARMYSISAELLWKEDEKRSRDLFAAAQEEILSGLSDKETEPETSYRTASVFKQLRSDTLTRIANHDPELAVEFLRATRPAPDDEFHGQIGTSEQVLELRLAGQIAAKNPKLASTLVRQAVAKGFSYETLSMIQQLDLKDREASLSVFNAIVEKLKSVDFDNDPYVSQVAMFLVQGFQPPRVDEITYRKLIDNLVDRALAAGCVKAPDDEAPAICYFVARVFPQIQKHDASGAASLKRWGEREGGGMDFFDPERPRMSDEASQIMNKGTVDEILALAEKTPELAMEIRLRALEQAQAQGDFATARKIAADLPEGSREYMLQVIKRNEMLTVVDAEKLTAIQEKARQLTNDDERLKFLFRAAYQIGGKNPKPMITLLNQADQIADSMKPGKKQLQTKLGIAMLLCDAKSDRGFAIMESLLPRLNELVANALILDGFETNYLRDGEWNMSGEGGVGETLNILAQQAGFFARSDFDRAVELSNQFERPELQIMAKLKLAQSVLAPVPLLPPSRY